MPFVLLIAISIAVFVMRKFNELSGNPHLDKDYYPNIHNESKQVVSELPFSQLGGTINDVTGVNRTVVYGIVKVTTQEDIKNSLRFARDRNIKVSIAGTKHSMGGQPFATNALVLDMRALNKMTVDIEKKILTVQSGAVWHDVQNYLNAYSLAIIAMQDIDVPTVGGTVAVNAHGMDHRVGGIASTIKSLRVMFADGTTQTLNINKHEELVKAIVGGYGLLGVVLEVQLQLMDNLSYREDQTIIKTDNFLSEYAKIINDENIHMFYARLSTAPSSFLKEMICYKYRVVDRRTQSISPLTNESLVWLRRIIFNSGRKNTFGRQVKWWAEKYVQPHAHANPATRNQMMHRSYSFVKNNLKNNTDVLQEYFLPKAQALHFINELGTILKKNKVVTRNVEIRSVYKEDILLDYAQGDWLGVVLYLNFDAIEKDIKQVMNTHQELIALSQRLGGSFYLPYQLSATREQINKSYPNFSKLLELKKKYDPQGIFTSTFFEKYGT